MKNLIKIIKDAFLRFQVYVTMIGYRTPSEIAYIRSQARTRRDDHVSWAGDPHWSDTPGNDFYHNSPPFP